MKTTGEAEPDNPKERPNKSALKRESAKLRELGETLLALNARQLDTIPLPAQILKAMDETRGLKHRDARKRQLQFIGKLLGRSNLDEIQRALLELDNSNRFFRQRFKKLDKTVAHLVAGGDRALNELVTEYPELDRQRLRQLIRKAQKVKPEEHDGAGELVEHWKLDPARRHLFNYLEENLK